MKATKKEIICAIRQIDEMIGIKPLSRYSLGAKNRAALETIFERTMGRAVVTMYDHPGMIQDDAIRNQIDAIEKSYREDLNEKVDDMKVAIMDTIYDYIININTIKK